VGRRENSGRNAGVLFLPGVSVTFAKASGGALPPFPLRSKGNFPGSQSVKSQPCFFGRKTGRPFLLDIRKKRQGIALSLPASQQTGPTLPWPHPPP